MKGEVGKYQAPGGLAAGRVSRRKVYQNIQFWKSMECGTDSVPHGHFPPLFPFGNIICFLVSFSLHDSGARPGYFSAVKY